MVDLIWVHEYVIYTATQTHKWQKGEKQQQQQNTIKMNEIFNRYNLFSLTYR